MNTSCPLAFSNTLTGTKDLLKPLESQKIRLYVCGITPYDFAHMGHARVYIFFDSLYRFLTFLGYEVRYCRNFTDIDDKIIDRAQLLYNDKKCYGHVAEQFITAFEQDMHALGCLKPTFEPRVTQTIPEIIDFIAQLIKTNNAYEVKGDVYFAVNTYERYGQLSKQKLDELKVGARVEQNSDKKSQLDFALWKSEPQGEYWQSPWGWGRPGWHIECSAMAKKYLGECIDIHGGGADLIFPHHENERAQTESFTHKPFSSIWLHNAFVQINKEKMSKSLGNFFTIRTILEQYPPMVIRFLMLNHHYRSPIDFTVESLSSIAKGYENLCSLFTATSKLSKPDLQAVKNSSVVAQLVAFLQDDFNSVGALGVIFKNAKLITTDSVQQAAVYYFITEVFGLSLDYTPVQPVEAPMNPIIEDLLEQRKQARIAKDWPTADRLRQELIDQGYIPKDQKAS